MRVVGLDWAVKPRDRAAVVLDKSQNGVVTVSQVITPVADDDAIRLCTSKTNDIVAVDIPFAWPKQFVAFVSNWKARTQNSQQPPRSIDFRYRTTDRVVHQRTGKYPLSISSNLFAIGARQWAELVWQSRLGAQISLSQGSRPKARPFIIEVYPAATLRVLEGHPEWMVSGRSKRLSNSGGQSKEKEFSYKTDELTRRALVGSLIESFKIDVDATTKNQLVCTGKKDHAADALLAALTGLFFMGEIPGWTVRSPEHSQVNDADAEGWIFFPERLQQGEPA